MTKRGRVLVMDTSVLCCLLEIPGKDACGPAHDRWDHARIQQLVEDETQARSTIVIPIAAMIEVGNHITNSRVQRRELAERLISIADQARRSASPWALFVNEDTLWRAEGLQQLLNAWKEGVAAGLSLADTSIRQVAEFYSRVQYDVVILTGDAGLKSFEPSGMVIKPRRRS